MNAIKKIGVLGCILSMILFSCRKDELSATITNIPPTPESIVEASLFGQVVDESGMGLEGVNITVGLHEFLTDENGVFKFDDIQMEEAGTYIKGEKAGYFLGAKFVSPKINSRSFTQIMLIEKTMPSSLQAESGGAVSTMGDATLSFPGNGIRTETGNNYTGALNVFAKRLNPADDSFMKMVPGDFRAIDQNEEIVQLVAYGMIAVDLENPSGQELNVKNGATVAIDMPIPDELLTDAPATIPLWHFDENTGYWKEEGMATLAGNKYEGEVSHFSFWCWALPFPVVDLSGNVVDSEGNPVQTSIFLRANSGNILPNYAFTFSDENGYFSGKVPMDEELSIQMSLDNCALELYDEVIGSFSTDAVLPTIVLSLIDYSFQFDGLLTDCDGNAVNNGYALVAKSSATEDFGSHIVPADANGNVSRMLRNCQDETEIKVIGYDLNAFNTSEKTTHDITGLNGLDVGNIVTCDDGIAEYINYTIDGNNFSLPDAIPIVMVDQTIAIQAWMADTNEVSLVLDEVVLGTQVPSYMRVSGRIGAGNYLVTECGSLNPPCGAVEVTISELGTAAGELVEGSFTGQIPDFYDSSLMRDVQGDFRVIIEE